MKISLDLLPKNKKAEIKREKVFREILREGALFFFPVLVLAAILGNVFYLLILQRSFNNTDYAVQQGQEKYQELSKYNDDFKKINESSGSLIRIQNGHLRWSNVFDQLGQGIPGGIMIEGFSNKNYTVYLIGKALSRDKLLEFKANLGANSCFENVNVPLSNLVVKDNVDFQIDFGVKQECLKGKNQ